MSVPKNLDDMIIVGLQSRNPLTIELARNLEQWRQYASELQLGIKNLEAMIDPTDRLRKSGF